MRLLAYISLSLLTACLAWLAFVVFYTVNPMSIGGHLPFLMVVGSPALMFALARTLGD